MCGIAQLCLSQVVTSLPDPQPWQDVADANKEEMTTFWDNDSLAALLGVELRADLVMLMTDVNGLFTGPPKEPSSE